MAKAKSDGADSKAESSQSRLVEILYADSSVIESLDAMQSGGHKTSYTTSSERSRSSHGEASAGIGDVDLSSLPAPLSSVGRFLPHADASYIGEKSINEAWAENFEPHDSRVLEVIRNLDLGWTQSTVMAQQDTTLLVVSL